LKGIDSKLLSNLSKRLSVFDHYHNNDKNDSADLSDNWTMINAAIEEHEGDPWFIPKETVVNAWTSQIYGTLGNISLRNFALERKFFNMRQERVQEYKRKWEEARDKNDKEYLSTHICFGLDNSFWSNWTQEEINYYSNVDRFPILKTQEGPYLWDKANPMYEATEKMRLHLNRVNNR
jgi:hypothetical protein